MKQIFLKDLFVCSCNFGWAGSLLLYTWSFSSCGDSGHAPVTADKLLIAVTSVVTEHRL